MCEHSIYPFIGVWTFVLFLLFVYYDSAISIHYKFLCGHTAFISLGYKTKSGTTGSYGNSIFKPFGELPDSFPQWLHHFINTFSSATSGVSNFSTSSPKLAYHHLFDCSHPGRYEITPHCGLGLHFPKDEQCWESIHVFICHMYTFFRETLFTFFVHF